MKAGEDMPERAGPIWTLFRRWCGTGDGQKGSKKAKSVDFKEFTEMLKTLKLMPNLIGKHKAQEIFNQANRRQNDPLPDGDTTEMDWDEFEFAVRKVCEFCKVDAQSLVGETAKQKDERIRSEKDAANVLAEDRRRKEAEAAQLALLDCKILGKESCPKPEIGMRVKLQKAVPTFIRDLTEPAVRYRRPPPLIGTVVKVVGNPLEQRRTHHFKYRRCNQTGHAKYPVAMWCDVRWDAPANGEEVTITGYHTGRFGMHYLRLVTEDEDPRNDPRNVALREEMRRQLALKEAVAQQFRTRSALGHEATNSGDDSSRLPSAKGSRPRSADKASSTGSKTPGMGHTPRYWADSQAATESRAYHSQEALNRGLDFAGKEKALDRIGAAQRFWDDEAEETPNQRRLRRFSAGHRPNSSSHLAQQEIIKSRPSSRGSVGSGPLISSDYDVLRPASRGSTAVSIASGERPISRGLDGILRPESRGELSLEDEARPASRGSFIFSNDEGGLKADGGGWNLRPGSVDTRFRTGTGGSMDDRAGESIYERAGSSTKGSVLDGSRPGTGENGHLESTSRPGTGTGYGASGGSRPGSRANVRFSDGSRPGSALVMAPLSNDPGFDRPQSSAGFLPDIPNPRSSDSEHGQGN